MTQTLVINSELRPVAYTRWQRAVSLYLTDQASVFDEHPTEQVRSQHLTIALPTIIQLRRWTRPAWSEREVAGTDGAANRAVMARDKNRCAYCAGPATTVDHVLPKSRGGQNTWDNLVAACTSCNNDKDDRTPHEWARADRAAPNRALRREPWAPVRFAAEQARVYEIANERYGAVL